MKEGSFFNNKNIVPLKVGPESSGALRPVEGTMARFWRRGVFFDVYELQKADGKLEPWVIKDFRSGDLLKTPVEQAALFQHQYYEWNSLRKTLGENFFPESYWVRNGIFTEDEMHGFYAQPGVTANTYAEIVKIQLDRQLGDRYSSDDKKKSSYKKLMSAAGRLFSSTHEQKPFIGAIIQERVVGLSFSEALKKIDKNDQVYGLLKRNVKELIANLRQFHDENEFAAFTWHGLDSDNVVAEVDKEGKLTGRIVVLDANFTERPGTAYRSSVLKKLESNVFAKLEQALEL